MDKKCIDVKRFILTGTPGSGKTSVINALEKHAYSVIHESATDVIAQAQAKGIERPWEELDFTDKIVRMQKERQMSATGNFQFYDRSPFCTYALGKYLGYALSHIGLDEIDRCLKAGIYENKVFFFENLGFIEHTDARKISFEDALIFEQIHLDVYKQFDFEIIIVPKKSIEKRCEFVLEHAL